MHPDVFLYHADMRDALKLLPDNCIDSVCTDPPYHLTSVVKRFGGATAAPAKFGTDGLFQRSSRGMMGKQWDGGDIAFQVDTWREVLRVVKPGGYVAAFGAPRNFGRLQCAILDAGFDERDTILNLVDPNDAILQFIESLSEAQYDVFIRCVTQSELSGFLAWTFGTGFPKSHSMRDIGHPELGTALKPAFEPIVLARKPLSEPTVAANVLRWRTGALNIDACRVEGGKRSPGFADSLGQVERSGSLMGAKTPRANVDESEGRWPANVVHDGSDEVVGAFPDNCGNNGQKSAFKRTKNNVFGEYADDDVAPRAKDKGSAARFFYSAKASKADRAGSKHPTVKPVALMQWLARLVTPPGGVILDPFAGSGTTGAAALAEGFKAVLCEREDEYVADIRTRIANVERAA